MALYDALYVREGSEAFDLAILHREDFKIYYEAWGSKSGDLAYVIDSGEKLLGAAWGRCFCESDQSHGFVDENTPELTIAIDASIRGKSWGTRLLNKLINGYRTLSFSQVSLSVDQQNRVIRLYESLGFEIVSEQETAFTMLKLL